MKPVTMRTLEDRIRKLTAKVSFLQSEIYDIEIRRKNTSEQDKTMVALMERQLDIMYNKKHWWMWWKKKESQL